MWANAVEGNKRALARRYDELKDKPVAWDEDRTKFAEDLVIDGATYGVTRLFDVLPVKEPKIPRDPARRVTSPSGGFHYLHAAYPAGTAADTILGRRRGHVWFTKPVVTPMLRTGTPGTAGEVWMSLMPTEMFTQRPGIKLATGTVLVGGLGLGWFLNKVCAKKSVRRVIVVERSQELLDWLGPAIRRAYPHVAAKVSDWICGDALEHVGKHGDDTRHLLDIWRGYNEYDHRFLALKRKVKHLWGWGQFAARD
jgi:hypothetical protein